MGAGFESMSLTPIADMASDPTSIRVVGRIIRLHGLRGELVVEVRTDSPEDRFAPGSILKARARDGSERPLTITGVRPHSDRLLVTFSGVADRDSADALRGTLLCLDVTDLPVNDDPDEFYDHQLEGLAVELIDGSRLGVLREVLHLPAGEVLAVRGDGAEDVLIPFVKEIVPTVDLTEGKVVVDPPDGLLDDR